MQEPLKLVLVGESNPYGADPQWALWDEPERASGFRLRTVVLGVSHEEYLHHDRLNLVEGKWAMKDARRRAETEKTSRRGAVFVLLGRKVQAAFGFKDESHFSVHNEGGLFPDDGHTFVILPHPSGLCREWYQPGAVSMARAALREAAPGVVLGTLTPR